METRNVVFALIGILLLLGGLAAGLWGGCMIGGLVCGCCGLTAGGFGEPAPYIAPPAGQPYQVYPTPQPSPQPWVPQVGQADALITRVIPNSPADEAGLQPGDIIFSVDRQRLEAGQDLKDIISRYRPGDMVTLGVWRNGRTEFVRVRLGEHPEAPGQSYLGIYFRALGQGSSSPPAGD